MNETILKQVTDQEVEKILDHARIGNKIYLKGKHQMLLTKQSSGRDIRNLLGNQKKISRAVYSIQFTLWNV